MADPRDRPVDGLEEVGRVDRLREVAVEAHLDDVEAGLDRRHHDDPAADLAVADPLEDLATGEAGQAPVEEDDVDGLVDRLEGLLAGVGHDHLVGAVEPLGVQRREVGLVLDDEDPTGRCLTAHGGSGPWESSVRSVPGIRFVRSATLLK